MSSKIKIHEPIFNPVNCFIPQAGLDRVHLYQKLHAQGIVPPAYSEFTRPNLKKVDMMVLLEDNVFRFSLDGQEYKLTIKAGHAWDGASIPVAFVCCNMTKFNQYVLFASLIHDVLFALGFFSFKESNDIFRAILKKKKTPWLTRVFLQVGIRSFVGKHIYNGYRKGKIKTWMKPFVTLEKIAAE